MQLSSNRMLILLAALSFLTPPAAVSADPAIPQAAAPLPRAETESGSVSGVLASGIASFKGIPFAAPPVGPLRWRAPQPASHWQGIRTADDYGPICTQPVIDSNAEPRAQSEDCLTLNIWRPASSPGDAKLPVMLWIHGGGSFLGSGSDPTYDGSALARDGVVVVTINYRLGALGYFVHPALENASGELSADGMTANYGLMDQLAAMRWVRRNIAAFGGDPDNVTIFGESAGGCYVNMWMTSPVAKGLFRRAITQSCPGFIESRTMAEGAARGVKLANDLGVTGEHADALAKLRQLPAADFVTQQAIKGTYPFIDGVVVDRDPFAKLEDGDVLKLPWMLGANSFDASYLPYFGVDISEPLAAYSPQDRERILAAYAPDSADEGEKRKAALRFLTDMVMGAGDRLFADKVAKTGAPSWLYDFGYTGTEAKADATGVPHGGELGYVFGNAGLSTTMTSAADKSVSARVRRLWTDFAKGKLPIAQSWSAQHRTIVIDEDGNISTPRNWRKTQLDLALPFARSNAGRWDP